MRRLRKKFRNIKIGTVLIVKKNAPLDDKLKSKAVVVLDAPFNGTTELIDEDGDVYVQIGLNEHTSYLEYINIKYLRFPKKKEKEKLKNT